MEPQFAVPGCPKSWAVEQTADSAGAVSEVTRDACENAIVLISKSPRALMLPSSIPLEPEKKIPSRTWSAVAVPAEQLEGSIGVLVFIGVSDGLGALKLA